jgi:hypothetical protein
MPPVTWEQAVGRYAKGDEAWFVTTLIEQGHTEAAMRGWRIRGQLPRAVVQLWEAQPVPYPGGEDAPADRIVYEVVTKPGGVDGRDPDDKGGVVRFAAFTRGAAEEAVDAWSEVRARVVDLKEARREALAKLSPLDRLVLGLAESSGGKGGV